MSFGSLRQLPHRLVAAAGLLILLSGVAVGSWLAFRSSAAARASGSLAVADRGSVVVTVTGSGQVSAAGLSGSGAATSAAKPSGASPASAVGGGVQVAPRTSGQVLKLFVVPGQQVRAGEVLALLGDAAAVDAVLQARLSLEAAQARGAGQAMVALAQAKLAALTSPSKPVISQAELDLANARLAYETLRRASVPPTATALAAAKLAVTLAERKLGALYQPPSQATVLAAQLAVTQAQAKLNAVRAAPIPPLASELRAAELALTLARQQLGELVNPKPAESTAAQLAVSQAQAKLDALNTAAPMPDAAAVSAAQQELTLATATLAALTAPPATAAAVAGAQQDLSSANQALAALKSSGSASAAALTAAQQTVDAAAQRLSDLIGSPRLAALDQAQLDVQNAKLAQEALLHAPTHPTRTALAAAALAVRLAQQRLVQVAGKPERASLAQAQLDLATAGAGVQADGLKLASARGSLLLAQLHAASLTVRSPVAGTVTSVLVAPGSQVDPTVTIASVADLSHLFVTINMSEFDVANLKVGNAAVVNIAALGGTAIPGRVSAIAPVGVSNSGVVQFPVTVALTRTAQGLRPGMLASVQVITARRSGVVRVPLDAISYVVGGNNDGQSKVVVLDSTGHQRTRFVDLGLASSSRVEVLRGVKPGERLVLPQVTVANGGGGPASNAPAGIGVPPPSGDQQGQGGGGGG